MSIKVYSACAYYTGHDDKWLDPTYHAMKFIKAIKGDALNGFAKIPVPSLANTQRLNEASRNKVFDWFGKMARPILAREVKQSQRVVLVPIPGSTCTLPKHAATCVTAKLAHAVASLRPKSTVEAMLWWDAVMPKTRGGDPEHREPSYLYPHLRLGDIENFAKVCVGAQVVLVDDVCTSGGHVQACAAALARACGVEVKLAICAGQTVHEQVEDPFTVQAVTLSEYEPPDVDDHDDVDRAAEYYGSMHEGPDDDESE